MERALRFVAKPAESHGDGFHVPGKVVFLQLHVYDGRAFANGDTRTEGTP
jgi:hypothetical protein